MFHSCTAKISSAMIQRQSAQALFQIWVARRRAFDGVSQIREVLSEGARELAVIILGLRVGSYLNSLAQSLICEGGF